MRKINTVSCILYSKSEAANSDICWNAQVSQLKVNRILDILGKRSLFITQSSGSHSKGKKFLCRFNYRNPFILMYSKCIRWKHLPETRNPFCTHIHQYQNSTRVNNYPCLLSSQCSGSCWHFCMGSCLHWTWTQNAASYGLNAYVNIQEIWPWFSLSLYTPWTFHLYKMRMQTNFKLDHRK